MQDTARFIETFAQRLTEEAEDHGLVELARLLKAVSREAGAQARLLSALEIDALREAASETLH